MAAARGDIMTGARTVLGYCSLVFLAADRIRLQDLDDALRKYLAWSSIVAEKDPETYHSVAAKYGLPNETSWMVGNSPKSDINPALRAGLNAVFVPHDNTWVLEHEEVGIENPRGRLLRVDRFADLQQHF